MKCQLPITHELDKCGSEFLNDESFIVTFDIHPRHSAIWFAINDGEEEYHISKNLLLQFAQTVVAILKGD